MNASRTPSPSSKKCPVPASSLYTRRRPWRCGEETGLGTDRTERAGMDAGATLDTFFLIDHTYTILIVGNRIHWADLLTRALQIDVYKRQIPHQCRCIENDDISYAFRFSCTSLASASAMSLSLDFFASISALCLLGPPTQPPTHAIPSMKSSGRRPTFRRRRAFLHSRCV